MAEYIDREAARNELIRWCEVDNHGLTKSDVHAVMDGLPAADVAPVVHGEWKWDNRCGLYTCSECGALSPRENQDGEYIDCPAYCHECGAKMIGGADNG